MECAWACSSRQSSWRRPTRTGYALSNFGVSYAPHPDRNGKGASCRRERGVHVALPPRKSWCCWRRWCSSHVLCHTVAEDGYQVRVLTDVGIFTSQDTHESTKTTLAINKNTFRSLALARRFCLPVTITPGEESALSPRQNVATSVFYACACMHFPALCPGYSHPILSWFCYFWQSG